MSTVQEIETGALNARVPTRQPDDELNELGRLFNTMLNKISLLIQSMREALDNAAHDLRTPITRIRGIAEIALHTDSGVDDCRAALADCVEESDQLLRLLNTLMDISEAQAGALKLNLQMVNVSILLNDAIELYQEVAEQKHMAVSADVSKSIWVVVDHERIRQIMANLLDNAIKYTGAGGQIELRAWQESNAVMITVTDTGMGIALDDMPRIWDRLFRGDRSRSQRGLGLGLSLVKALVEAHGGHVEATSTLGSGSVFKIIFPAMSANNRTELPDKSSSASNL